jgi:TonB family protein
LQNSIRRTSGASGALFLAACFAAAEEEIESLLRLKGSPGSIALLASHTSKPAAVERLQSALRDPDPRVRGVAARVVNLGSLSALVPDAAAALEKESDAEAAREQVRLLIAHGGGTYDEAIRAAGKRLAPSLDSLVVRTVARVRGAAALPLYFSSLRELSLTDHDRKTFFRLASRGEKDSLNAAAALALGRNDALSWKAILSVSTELQAPLDEGVLVSALPSENGTVRGEAAWYLAKRYCETQPGNMAPVLAAVPAGGAPAGGDNPELRFGAEMLRRVLGEPPVEDKTWIACIASNLDCYVDAELHLDSDLEASPLFPYLTLAEREALLIRNAGGAAGRRPGFTRPHPDDRPHLRLVSGIPRGVASSLFDVAGCRSSAIHRRLSLATLEFRADGLPAHAWVLAAPEGKWCERVANTLFLLSLAPGDASIAPGDKRSYLALYDPESIVCGEEDFPVSGFPATDPLRVRSRVAAPRLKKKVEPSYPAEARKAGEEGMSVYEAIISASGCVQDVRLVKSSTPRLDVLGMEAVSRWKYEPATLDGRPVRVYLTVTVTWGLGQKR